MLLPSLLLILVRYFIGLILSVYIVAIIYKMVGKNVLPKIPWHELLLTTSVLFLLSVGSNMVTAHSLPIVEIEGWEDLNHYIGKSSTSTLKIYGRLDSNLDN